MARLFSVFLFIGSAVVGIAQEPSYEDEGIGMTLEEVLMITLDNNVSLRIDRLDPQISELGEDIAKAAFDTSFGASAAYSSDDVTAVDGVTRSANDTNVGAGITQRLSTGTRIDLDVDFRRDEPTAANQADKRYTDSLGA